MKLTLYFLTLILHTGLIWFWYTFVAKSIYGESFVNFAVGNVNYLAAGVVYLLYTAGLFYFTVVIPLGERYGSVSRAAFYGAFFGMMGPAASLWTNLTSRHLPLWFIGMEIICWPTFMALTAVITVKIGKKWEEKLKSRNKVPTL